MFAFDAETFARNVIFNFVSDAFRYGLFHADLHPANLLVLRNNVVGYVDFGITGALSRHTRQNLVAMTLALTRADSEAMHDHFLRLTRPGPGSDLAGLESGFREMINRWFAGHSRIQVPFTQVMVEILQLCQRTQILPTPDAVRYMRSVITADGVIARFAPAFDVGQYLEQVCLQALERDVWREWASAEALADWTAVAQRLLTRGPAALLRVLPGGTPGAVASARRSGPAGRRRALQLALVTCSAAALAAVPGPLPGWNVATASLVLCVVAGTATLLAVKDLA